MEVFDKEGVALRKNRSEGFVMAEVLVTVLFVTVFTSLLFSSGARRYRSALNFAAGTEARLAAEAVVQILVENMCQEEPTGILEKLQGPEGLPETEAASWAKAAAWRRGRDRPPGQNPLGVWARQAVPAAQQKVQPPPEGQKRKRQGTF